MIHACFILFIFLINVYTLQLLVTGIKQCQINYGSGGSPELGPLNSGASQFQRNNFYTYKIYKKTHLFFQALNTPKLVFGRGSGPSWGSLRRSPRTLSRFLSPLGRFSAPLIARNFKIWTGGLIFLSASGPPKS